MVFLLYIINKSRDLFTKIIIEDFPSIKSRGNALNMFNMVYWFIFTFCLFIIMVDVFDLNSSFPLFYSGESVNIKFLSPVKWLLTLFLKIVLTYITNRSPGWVSFKFIFSVFSLECNKRKIELTAEIKNMLETLDQKIPWDFNGYNYWVDLRKWVTIYRADLKLVNTRAQELVVVYLRLGNHRENRIMDIVN